MEELFELVKRVPYGRVASYGDLGRSLTNPVSGLVAGNWMQQCPGDLPWWRVVGKDGTLHLAKRDPAAAVLQRELLESEGVIFEDDKVAVTQFLVDPRDFA